MLSLSLIILDSALLNTRNIYHIFTYLHNFNIIHRYRLIISCWFASFLVIGISSKPCFSVRRLSAAVIKLLQWDFRVHVQSDSSLAIFSILKIFKIWCLEFFKYYTIIFSNCWDVYVLLRSMLRRYKLLVFKWLSSNVPPSQFFTVNYLANNFL